MNPKGCSHRKPSTLSLQHFHGKNPGNFFKNVVLLQCMEWICKASIYFFGLKFLCYQKSLQKGVQESLFTVSPLLSFPSTTGRELAAFCTFHYHSSELFTLYIARLASFLHFPSVPLKVRKPNSREHY